MKKNKIKPIKTLLYQLLILLGTITSVRSFGQANEPFNCNDGFGYLFQGSPADVFQVNLQTGVSTKVKNNVSTSAVSAGYNPIDNFIWMVDKGNTNLIKVDANWNVTAFNTNLPRNIHVVDIDANGIFYAYSGNFIYRYDLNTIPSPTQLSTLTSGSIPVSDFAFNPLDGFIYSVSNDARIFKTNPANGSTSLVRTITGLPEQTYGAVYFDGEGTLYLSGNGTGEIFKISNTALTNPASTESVVFFSNGPSASQNDGARCAKAPLCKVGTTRPVLNQTSASNTCSANSVNLANISASNTPDATILTWHTGTPTTNANRITNLTVTNPGTYYATFYDGANNCYSTTNQAFTVTINPIPTVPSTISVNRNTICVGESATLNGSCGVGIVNWYVNNSNGALAGTGNSLSVSPTSTTSYVATCKSINPTCESAASAPVTVTANPTPAAPTIIAGSSRICRGTSTTLTALGCNGTVNWSTGATGTSISVSPTVQTGYSATCTNASGCVSNASNSSIEITIANIFFSVDKQNLCSGESVTLTMGGCNATRAFFANGNLISSSSNDILINTPAANVTYTATCGGVAATACATNSTAGVPVTVRTTPTPPVLSGGRTICVGSSAILTAAGCSGTVNWSNSQTGTSISVSPSTTTSYTATCLVNGCVSAASGSITVIVENIPASPTNLADATICSGESINLGGNCATGNVIWYNSAALTTTVSMPVSPSSNATYYVTCNTTNCRSSSVAVPVKVNPTPNTPTNAVANPSSICQGKASVLSANCSGGSSIAFFSDPALTTRLPSATVSPTSNITYFAACELAGCKSSRVSILVAVRSSPITPTDLTPSATICKGTSTTLNGTCPSGSTIQWYQGVVDGSSLLGTGSGLSVSPNETTIYVATCKDNANSCESPQSSNINISVADTPNTPTGVSISSTSICAGTSVTLSGNCSSGALKFYTNVGLTDEAAAVNTPTATTTYYATCIIGACKSATVNRTVEVKPQPIAVASSNTPVCIGSTLQLSAANTVSGAAYSWTGPNNFSSQLQNPSIPNVTGAANGPYNLTVSLNGCTASTSTTVVINQQPNLSLSKTDVLCAGENTGTITVNGSLASPPYMYSRNGGNFQSSNVFIGVANGFNTITIRDSKGCTNSAQITVEQPLVLNFTNTSNPSTCGTNADGRISVTGVTGGTSPYSYQINNGGFSNVNIFNNLIAGTYAITVRDNNGCERSKNLTVEATPDNIPPTIVCPPNISVNATAGICGAVVTYTTPVGTDNCSGSTTTQTAGLASGSIFPVGTTTNTFRVTDAAGNATSCSFTVTVADNIPPTIVCPSNISTNVTAEICGAVVTYTTPVGTDNCSGSATTQTAGLASGATFPIGTTTNTFRVTDAAGNSTSCSFTVTVTDNIPPVITCPTNILANVTPGTCGTEITYTAPVGTDNCAGRTTTQIAGLVSGATFPIGTTTNTFRVIDAAGNSTSCSFTVTVTDNIPPTIVCPANISVNATAGVCGAVVTYTTPVGTDNCTGSTTTQIAGLASGATFPIGTTTNTFRVIDAAGNATSCSFTVTVTDNIPPTIVCPANISVNATAGICGAVVTYTAPVGTDNCTGSTTTQTAGLPSGATFPIGTTTNTFRVIDAAGNATSCSFTVTVADNIPPVITCPTNISVNATAGICGAIVTYTAPVGTDNCTGSTTTQTTGLASGSTFPVGTTTNTFRVTDAAGNATSCSFTVTVADNIPPTIVCPTNILANVTPGTCSTEITYTAPVGTDNCAGSTTVQTGGFASGATFPVGTTTNTFTVTDAAGNSTSCSFDVTVIDNIPPVIDCPDDISVDNDNGECGAIVNYTPPMAMDNCVGGNGIIFQGFESGDRGAEKCWLFPGVSFFSGAAVSGNFGARTGQLTGNPNSVDSPFLQLNGSGNLTFSHRLSANNGDNRSLTVYLVDEVEIRTQIFQHIYVISQGTSVRNESVPLNQTGIFKIQWEFTGTGGNSRAFLDDLTIPASYAFAADCSAQPSPRIAQTDNTGLTVGSFFPVGTTTLEYTATDASGNSSKCTFDVTVNDTQNPVINCPENITMNVTAGLCDRATITFAAPTTSDNCAGETFEQIAGLPSGSNFPVGTTTNTFEVTDAAGNKSQCSFDVIINAPPTLVLSIENQINVDCFENATGSFAVNVTGGATPYSYVLDGGTPQNSNTFSELTAGTYNVVVTDANGCSQSTSTEITEPTQVVVSVTSQTEKVCENTNTGSITVAGSGGTGLYEFKLNDGNFQSGASFTDFASGNYTITVKDENGCTSTVSAEITTFTQPTATASSNAPLCVGQNLNLTAEGGVSYAWAGPNFTSDLQNSVIENVTAANAGTYTLTVTSADGCEASTTTNVVVNPLPIVVSTSNSPVCETKTLNFTTQTVAGASYSWRGPNNFTSNLQNPSIPNVPLAANGAYKLIITNANGCQDSTEVNVEIKKQPVAEVASNSPICAGDLISLTATDEPGATYSWSGANGFTSNLQNPEFTATSAIQSGSYEVVVTLDGCTNSAKTDVVVFDLPVANASSNAPICEEKALNFTAENAGTGAVYSWSGPNGFTSTLQNPSIASPTVLASGKYILTVTKNNCVNRDTIDVIVKLKPSVSITPIIPICATETLMLSATATDGVTYAWSGPNSFTSTLQNPEILNVTTAATGVYELIVSLDGCTNSTSINVVVNRRPIASVMGTTPVCEGETVDLSAANAGTGATYSWTGPEGFTSNLQNPSFDNAVPSQSGFYVMTATLGDCSAKDSVEITINPRPTLSITSATCLPNLLTYEVKLTATGGTVTTSAGEITDDGNGEFTINNIISGTNIVVTVTSDEDCVVSQEITAPDCSCPVVDAPISEGDEIICRTEDNPVLLVTVGTNETVDWYTTASGGTTILENSLTFTPTETAVGTQTYYAETRDTINQCVSSTRTEVKLTIKPKSEITVNGVSPICQDDTIRLSSSADLAGVSYQWSGPNGFTAATQNVNIPAAKVSDSGFYKLTVDLNSCTDADSVEITVKPKPTPISNSNSPVCEGFPINLSVNETAATTYVWSGPKNYSSELPNPSIADATPDMSGTYQVIATLNGCSDTTSTEVVVNAKPTITTTAPKCAVDLATYAVKFTAVGGTVVTSAGEIANDSVKNIPSGTNIKLIITSAEGCQDSTEVIAPDCLCPAIEAPISAGDSAICENAEIPTFEVSVNSDETVDWYDAPSGGNLIAGNTLTYTPTNSVVGEYTFYAEARRSDITIRTCVSSTRTPVTLTIKPLPVVIASSNSPVCENDTLRLTAQEVSGATYEWSKNGTIFTTKKDTTIVKSGLTLNGIFTLKITLNGCENSNTTNVIIKPLPIVTALSNATDNGICATDTIRLFVDDAANADTYEWTGPQGFTETGASVTRFAESTDFAGKYVVKSTLDGCSTTDTVTVNLRPLPNAVANNTSPVCAGDSVRFSAATVPNATYEWFDPAGNTIGAGKDIILRNTVTDQSGKYTVKVTLNSCSKVDTTEVIVKHRPVVIATDVTICSGDTLFLNATRDSTSTYKWVGPLSFASSAKDTLIAKSRVSNSGNYIVTATLNGCSSRDTATVIVKPLPLTVPLSNSPVCEASPINLSAENAGTNATYAWSGPDGFTTDVQNPIIDSATLQKAGFYVLTVSRNGCVKMDSVEIEIKKLPKVIFTNNSPICVNDTLKISVQPIAGATYQWSGPKEFMSADSAISLPNIQTDHAGTYQVTLKLNGCEKTDSITVRVVENPLAQILTNSPVCELDTLKLTAANAGDGAAYEWIGPNNFSSSESNPSVAPMTEVTAGFYYLKVTLNNCVAFDTTEVQFKPLPKVHLTSNSPVCVGDTLRISSGNPQTGTTFNWSGSDGFVSTDSAVVIPNVQSINGGLYQLTSMLDGCFRNDSIRITVKDLPEAIAEVEQDSLCVGERIKLTARNAGTDATYRWIGPDDFVSNEQNPDIENVVAKNSGKYILTVSLDDCKASDSVDVFVRPLPEIALDSAFCSADLLSYSVKITTNSENISASAGIVDGEFIRDIPKDIASVKITVINDKGCVDSLTVNAPNCECPVIQLPEFAFTDSTICFGTQTPTFAPILGTDQVIDLYDTSTGGVKIDSNKLAYQFVDIQPNTYTLFAETRDTITNCVSASRVKLTLKINPLPLIEIDEILPLCERDTLKLNAQGEGTFEWFGSKGFASVEMSSKLKVDPSDSGEYIVVATLNKCTNSDTVQVVVNPIINVGVSEVFCSADLNTYTVELQTSATNITASAGIVDGKFIREIPMDSASVQITVTSDEGCANTITVNAPNCKCPQIDLPEFNFVDSAICANSESPIFTATVGDNQTVDFYDAITGGTKLDSTKLNFQFTDNEISSYEIFAESRDTLSNCVSSSRVKLTLSINALPTLEIDSVFCSTDLATYSVKITANSDKISASIGIVDGEFIRDIPKDSASVIIRVVNESGCEDSVTVNAPNCECDVIPRPEFSFTDSSVCIGAESPIFTATVGDNQTVDFYDAATGGTKVDSMKLSYQFTDNEIGSYEIFAESRDTLSNCVSSSRVKLSLTINALPTLEIDSVFCSTDLATYSVKINANSDNISTSAGIVDGEFIRDIPKDSLSVIIKVINESGCEDSVTVNAPNCECDVIPRPEFSLTDSSICIGAESPIFTATIGDNQTVDFYDAATGGMKVDSMKTSYQFPDIEVGSYEIFAEIRDTLSNCVSSSRVKLTFTINASPQVSIVNTACETDGLSFNVALRISEKAVISVKNGTMVNDSTVNVPSGETVIIYATSNGCIDSLSVTENCVLPRPIINISQTVSSNVVMIGDTVVYTIKVWNSGSADTTGVQIQNLLYDGATYISSESTSGIYDPATKLWQTGVLIAKGDTLILTIKVKVIAGGPWRNTAQLIDQNGNPELSVISQSCVSAIISICPERGERMQLVSPTELPTYQWFNNNQAIEGATERTYIATEAGAYTVRQFAISDSTCEDGNCCPIIIAEVCECKEEICVPFIIKKIEK